MKPVQRFSDDYLQRCAEMSPQEIATFLDDFRRLHAAAAHPATSPSRLISLKVPEDLLRNFRMRCDLEGVKYQTRIKQLMQQWLLEQPKPEDGK